MSPEVKKNRDIQNFLGVLSASVLCACLLAFIFIYYYGPSGRYVAGHTLLDPAVVQQINTLEKGTKNKPNAHFVFDRFDFSYFDIKTGQMRRVSVSAQAYQQFFQLISSIESLEVKGSGLEKRFLQSRPTLLTISKRALNSPSTTDSKIFQVVEFIEDDYFRVQLHDQRGLGEWAYYYKLNSYREILHLFTASETTQQ